MLNKQFPLDAKSISRLATRGLPMERLKEQIDESLDMFIELSRAQGLNIVRKQGYYFFDTKFSKIEDAEFCIVDIETNGSKIEKHQIIEIAAIKVKGGNWSINYNQRRVYDLVPVGFPTRRLPISDLNGFDDYTIAVYDRMSNRQLLTMADSLKRRVGARDHVRRYSAD